MFAEVLQNKNYRLMLLLAAECPSHIQEEEINNLIIDIDFEELLYCAIENDMNSIIYPSLARHTNKILPEIWYENYIKTKERISSMMNKLFEVANIFYENGIPLVVLKNGSIASTIITDLGKNPMGDIDTLIKKEDFKKAHHILIDMGFIFKFRSDYEMENLDEAFFDGGTEYYYKGNDNFEMWLELSWRPISGRWIRLDKEPNAEELISNSISVKNKKIKILSPVDNLLQVSIHTAKHSYVREPGLRLHLDVDRIVKYNNIDWKEFIYKVYKTKTKTAVYYSLLIPKQLFGTPIPSSVLNKLKPSSIKNKVITKMLTRARLVNPKNKKFSKFSFLIFQILLYDNIFDIFKVIVPSIRWLKRKYKFSCFLFIPYYIFLRIFDLIGLRKNKNVKK